LVSVGGFTSNNFDGGGTPFTASTLGSPPTPYFTNDGPAGNLFCLVNSGTNSTRNRITFNQTATGSYDRLTAEFAFRARSLAPAAVNGTPTRQDFDSAGSTYTLSQAGPTAPVVRPADAGSTGSYLRLVPASGSELGTIAFNRTATGAFNSIVATFDFRITPPSEANQADGMSFAILSTSAYGSSGAGPTFGEVPNLTSTIGLSFDVYNNGSTPAEPNNNHLSLHWNNAQIGNAVTPSFDLSNGRFHRAQVIIWFSGGNAYVTVRLTPDVNGTPGATETVLQNALIPGVAPYQSRVAFGARTGGAWAAHDLDNVSVEYSSNAAAAAGLSLLVLPVAQFGTTGPGTSLATFTDFPLVTNAFALDLAFNPSNLVNDVSLYWNTAQAATVSLPVTNLDLDAGVFHYARLQLDSSEGGAYATVTLTPNSLGAPGASLTVISNRFIPGGVVGNSRLELAARNGGLTARVDLENVLGNFQVFSPMLLSPGEYIVVVRNLTAFTSRYGTGIRVAGEYSGSLNNAGDRLSLLGPVGEPILDFSYDPTWFPITDGGGHSLVVVDPFAPPSSWGLAQQWRPSTEADGSPGAADPVLPVSLTIALLSESTVSVTWPAAASGFELYSTLAMSSSDQWARVTNAPVLLNDQWVVILSPLTNTTSFYRLQTTQ
jgi:hypothetical protein